MTTRLSAIGTRDRETRFPSWSKKTLFTKTKPSEEWHQQVEFTAGTSRPSEQKFPWSFLRKHTDHYLKKKGKLSQAEIDIKLSTLIEGHGARDVAIASCAHAMSPMAVRALLSVDLQVAPATYLGLEAYLQSLIAANFCSPKSVSDLEAEWAHRLLPYARHGSTAAGAYLEGTCVVLRATDTPNMNVLPDFAILIRRAFKDFAMQLEGMQLRCQWMEAYKAVSWMATIVQSTPPATPPGSLMPEHLLDTQFPIWRTWAAWKPDLKRIKSLATIDSRKRALLPDIMALDGPDFVGGTQATLREGLVAQYSAAKSLVRFKSFIVETPKCTKDVLRDTLGRVATALDVALTHGDGSFNLFTELAILRPITQEALEILEAMSYIKDTPKSHIHNAVLEVHLARGGIGGRHIAVLQHVICALDDTHGDHLRKVLLRPWLVQGIDKCVKDCQAAIRNHIQNELVWTHLALEFHTFCAIVKGSTNCLPLLAKEIQRQLDTLPPIELLRIIVDIHIAAKKHTSSGSGPRSHVLMTAIEAWCIDRIIERGTISHASQLTVDTIVQMWDATTTKSPVNSERRSLAMFASESAGLDFVLRCRCLIQIPMLPDE